jgi:hypothetical protein
MANSSWVDEHEQQQQQLALLFAAREEVNNDDEEEAAAAVGNCVIPALFFLSSWLLVFCFCTSKSMMAASCGAG